jgi:hypothetical protein
VAVNDHREQGGPDVKRADIARRSFLVLILASAALVPVPIAQAIVKDGPPQVSTGGVTAVRGTAATLLGSIDPRGAATTYYFRYGPTIAYGKQTTAAVLPAGIAKVKIGQAATGFLAAYHYRLVATNQFGTKEGKDRNFVTKKLTKPGFTLPKTLPPTIYGSAFTFTGTLTGTGNGNRKLVLQESAYPFLSPFSPTGLPIVTDATGHFTFRVPDLLASTQFRVSTLDPRPVYSPILTQHVAVRVNLKVRTTAHKGLVRLYGTVTPASVGARLAIQLRKAVRPGNSEKSSERTTKFATQFSSVVKAGTKTVSRFSTVVTVVHGGTYRAYVQLRKGGFVSGSSPTVLLHSAPTPAAKKTKR